MLDIWILVSCQLDSTRQRGYLWTKSVAIVINKNHSQSFIKTWNLTMDWPRSVNHVPKNPADNIVHPLEVGQCAGFAGTKISRKSGCGMQSAIRLNVGSCRRHKTANVFTAAVQLQFIITIKGTDRAFLRCGTSLWCLSSGRRRRCGEIRSRNGGSAVVWVAGWGKSGEGEVGELTAVDE